MDRRLWIKHGGASIGDDCAKDCSGAAARRDPAPGNCPDPSSQNPVPSSKNETRVHGDLLSGNPDIRPRRARVLDPGSGPDPARIARRQTPVPALFPYGSACASECFWGNPSRIVSKSDHQTTQGCISADTATLNDPLTPDFWRNCGKKILAPRRLVLLMKVTLREAGSRQARYF